MEGFYRQTQLINDHILKTGPLHWTDILLCRCFASPVVQTPHKSLCVSPTNTFLLFLIPPPTGGEQYVPGVSDRKQLRVLHHLSHGGAGACRHQDEGGQAPRLWAHPQLQLFCECYTCFSHFLKHILICCGHAFMDKLVLLMLMLFH